MSLGMMRAKKRRRIGFGTIIWSIIPAIALVAVAGFAGLSVARHVYPPIVPVSGTSMTPLLHFGDLVLLKKADYGNLRKGDIIAFRTTTDVQLKWNVPGSYVHRIVEVQKGAYGQQFQTKGDNVAGKDPFWTVEQNVVGVYAGKISGAGYPVLFIRSKQGKILMGAKWPPTSFCKLEAPLKRAANFPSNISAIIAVQSAAPANPNNDGRW